MKLPFIQFEIDQSRPGSGILQIGAAVDLKKITEVEMPRVMLISDRDAERLRAFDDVVLDRGRKDPRKGLAFYLLGKEKHIIPLICGDFTSVGKLENSILIFLGRARAAGDIKTFVIGITDDVFGELKKHVNLPAPEGIDTGPASQSADNTPLPETPDNANHSGTRDDPEMFDFPVPVALQRAYIGNSPGIETVRKMIMAAASSDIPVLILGPSGTGKELVARAIHQYSKCTGPFIAVNCGAIPKELMESELFGHKKGAFTGALEDKAGLWQTADGGTLFLDELGDILPEHQAKILRALESRKIRRIGENFERKANARIVAATNRDLFFMVKEAKFREDLYYRLRGVLIRTPALRESMEEIPTMVDTFWRAITENPDASLPESIKQELKSYPWPGNVRHLKSVLRQLHVFFPNKDLEVRHLHHIMAMDEPTLCEEARHRSGGKAVKPHLAKCLRHLRWVDEAVHASMAMIAPYLRAKRLDQEKLLYVKSELRHHLNEMEFLFQDPLLFGSHDTFTRVYHLKGKLTFFDRLLSEGYAPAREYWEKEVKDEFKLVLTTIFKEFETVIDQA